MSFFSSLFGKSPEEQSKEWIRNLRREQRKVDQQINGIQKEQQRVKLAMKQSAKKEDNVALRMLALQLVRSKKSVSRLYAAKATMNSVSMTLQHQMAQVKMTKAIAQSSDVMREMNQLIKIPEVSQNMQALSKEMSKAGMIGEMMNDTVDDALDQDISDGELETEVNKVVDEVVTEQMKGGLVGSSKLPVSQKVQTGVANQLEAVGESNTS